jgi:hypothetical protein
MITAFAGVAETRLYETAVRLRERYGDLSVVSEREPVKRGGAPSATSALWPIKQVLEGVKLLSNLLMRQTSGEDEIDADVRFRFRRGELR